MSVLLIDREQMQAPPTRQRCPLCGTIAPPYGFHLNGGDLGIIGMVKYFTIFCNAELPPPVETPDEVIEHARRGAVPPRLRQETSEKEGATTKHCGAILGVQIIEYLPPSDPAKLAALMAAMKGGPTQ